MNIHTLLQMWEYEFIFSGIVWQKWVRFDESWKVNCFYEMQSISNDEPLKLWWDCTLGIKMRYKEDRMKVNEWNKIHTKHNTTYVGMLRCLIILFFQRKMHWITKPRKRITLFAYFSFVCTTNQSSTCLHKLRCWFIRW